MAQSSVTVEYTKYDERRIGDALRVIRWIVDNDTSVSREIVRSTTQGLELIRNHIIKQRAAQEPTEGGD